MINYPPLLLLFFFWAYISTESMTRCIVHAGYLSVVKCGKEMWFMYLFFLEFEVQDWDMENFCIHMMP